MSSVEVVYQRIASPAGPLLAAASSRGLMMLAYRDDDEEALEEVDPTALDPVRRQLEEYFAGTRREFDMPLDWTLVRGFARAVLEATSQIPYGETRTYAEIAAEAGNPRAFRAAGNALGSNPIAIVIPCHRVVASGGRIGGYGGGLGRKRLLLDLERGARIL
ncbi:MAG: methylated-DNA--[protein]-cysteine S-methyltransferase [Thermoleophilia bacterium]